MDSKDLVARIESELGSMAGREDSPRLHPPPRVADHELIRCIGAGSYGEVWLARSVTGQWRAVKVIARARFSSDRPYEREFHGVIKFEPISRSHSGLVQVLHVGRDDAVGAFFYVMELADAGGKAIGNSTTGEPAAALPTQTGDSPMTDYSPRTLRSDLKLRGRLTVEEAVAMGVELTGALGHIHRHGLVHRDVKPSNVIFVQGQPKLADLGLVTNTDEARSFVGTEGFIPPEGPGTVKADLFALGRLLYEVATGKDRCEFPELPSDLDAWPDREAFLEFNEIITQLCAPDPARRYANAAEVAGDLNLILAGRSVRRANGVERRMRQARQIAVVAVCVLVLAAGIVWIQQLRRREAEKRTAHERSLRERAEGAEQKTLQQLSVALLEQARATVRSGEMGQRVRALDAARRAAAINNTAELRREVLGALTLPDLRPDRELPFDSEYTARELDPKFERIALCRGRGPVEIRATSDQRLLATLPAGADLKCFNLTWRGDGSFLAVKRDRDGGGARAELEVWDLRSDPRRVLLIKDARFQAWSFHPNQLQVLAAVADRQIVAWDLETGKELARAEVEVVPERLAYSPDGNSMVASYQRDDGWGVSVHAAADRSIVCSAILEHRISSLEWHPGGRWIALADFGGAIHLMDARSGATRLLGRHRAEAACVKFDATGDYLITGGWERGLICWDVARAQRAFTIGVDSYLAQFRADGLACAFLTDAGVQLHAFERPGFHRELTEALAARLHHAAFSPDGRWLAASSGDGVRVWDLAGGGPGVFAEHAPEARLFWTPDGTELFGSSSRDGSCYRWRIRPAPNVSAPPVLERLELRKPDGFTSLGVASNRVAWTGARGSRITEVEDTGVNDTQWTPTAQGINGLSPDGRWLGIYGSNTPVLHIHRLPGLERVAVLTNQGRIPGFSFSPSGAELAVVSRGQAEFWRTTTWQRTRVAPNFVGIPYVGMLFHMDGHALWLATKLGTAGLYDAQTFEPLLPLPAGMVPLAVSPDGRRLAVSVDARRLQVWDLAQVRKQLQELGLDWPDASR